MFGAAEIRNNSIVLSNSSKYAIKKNGGEIAIIEDSLMASSFVKIYTSIGELLASIPVCGQVASIGWSHREELLEIVFVDGYLQVYTEDFGNYKEFQILTKKSNEKIIEAQFFEDSSTISLTSDNRFIKLDLFDLKLFEYLIPECLEFNSPQCWTISGDESILFAQSSDVFKLSTNDELTKKQIPYKTICHMRVNENELIILTIDSRLIVLELNNNFQVKYDVNVGYDVEIFCVNGVDWLNSSIAVILQSASGKLHLVDLYSGKVLQLQFSKNFITEKEVDGIRVISQNNNCLITKMSTILVDLNFKSSSESIVSEFYDRYIKNELEEIRKFPLAKLVEIIDLCAKTLPQLTYQKSLRTNLQMALKISSEFLKDHLSNDDNSRQTFTYLTAMTQMSFAKCTSLDNIISHGISSSPLQFEDPRVIERLLTRLCRRNLYFVAFEIAVLLELDLTVIIMNWARQGILKSDKIIDDETLWYLISDKIFTWSSHRAINLDFFELADLALNNNRLKLSRKLINLESNNRKKIELLAALPDHRIAIIESIKTGSQDQMNSSNIPYSRSKGSSIEELKAIASSKSEFSYSPAFSSSTRASIPLPSLNIPRDSTGTRIDFSRGTPLGRNINIPLSDVVSGTSSVPQVNLRTTAQILNGWIQKDKISLDLEEMITGQFSREYIYGDEHRPILQFNRLSVIPEILLNQIRQLGNADGKCLMGVFSEINRAWLVAGNALYLWSFENNRDFTCYLKSPYDIIDVALIRVKSGVFVEAIEWALVVVTAVEIFLLAVSFETADQSNSLSSVSSNLKSQSFIKNYSVLDLVLHETDLRFPSDEVYMVSVCGTHNGRIFLAGNDGNIYELLYKSEADWFSSKCKKVNRTATSLSYIIPTFLRSSPERIRVVKLVHDSTRHFLYGLTEESTIQMYWLGQSGTDFEFIGVTGDLSIEATKLTHAGIITSSTALSIISIHPVFGSESDRINLVAICRSGIRLYFSSVFHLSPNPSSTSNASARQFHQQQPQYLQAPRCLRLVHIRAPPEENRIRDPKKMVHRWSPNLHCAFYSNGVTLAANTITSEEDLILGMILNPSIGSASSPHRLPMEYSVETPIEGKVWAIEELNRNEILETDLKKLQSEFSISHGLRRRSFVILTNFGAYIFSKLRPIDQLYLLLSERSLPWDQLERFFESYGTDQSCAFCIALCCGPISDVNSAADGSDSSSTVSVTNNAIAVLFKFGGQPRLLDSFNQHQHQHNSIIPQSNAREAIGRIIATQPEFENSAMYEGFFIFFSRLISKIWKKCLWDIQSIPENLFADLHRFFNFISDHLSHFTDNRTCSTGQTDFTEDLARRQKIALDSENDSLLQLKEITKLLIELLAFIAICIDYNLIEFLRSEPISQENFDIDVESLITSFKGKSLITEIGNILVQRQLRLRTPVRSLCENLRARCGSFFSEDDVVLQEAIETLERARVCKNEIERAELVSESLQYLLKACKVVPLSNLFLIFDQLDLLGYPDASIRLGLRYIETMDPENITLNRENTPELALNLDQHEICRQRENIYDRLMQSIGCTGFVQEYTNPLLSNIPGISVDSLRIKCINLATASQDKLFHFRFYDWLIRHQFSSTILELPHSESLQAYLKTTFLTRSDTHRDLLWKWLAKAQRYSEAASVLSTIAESREYTLSLSERIEYLSLAVALFKSKTVDNIPGISAYTNPFLESSDYSPIELHEIEERLEVAHIQMELLQDAVSSRGNRNDPICVELDGPVGLLSVTEMFNRYSRPYGLSENCLRLIHVSGLVNERLVAQLWQEIISKYLGKSSDRASFQVLGSKISELAHKLYPSPGAFPFAHLIDVLGRLSISANIQPDWLVVVFIEAGIPFTAISDEFHRFFVSSPSKAWLSPSYRVYLLEMLAILYVLYNNDPRRNFSNNSSVISRIKSYATVADELHASELVNEFGTILRKLASL